MKVLLISTNAEQINMPALPLGLGCAASAARQAGHEIKTIDLLFEEDIQSLLQETIASFVPDLIGMSIRNIDDQNRGHPSFLLEKVREVASQCRRFSRAPIVLGGAGYSLFPESVLDYLGADMGIQGEGELAFPILLERLQRKLPLDDVPGLYLAGKGLQGERIFSKSLDDFSYPDAALWTYPEAKEFWIPFQTRRGCPFACSYCSTSTIEGRNPRKRSPEEAVKALKQYAEAGFQRFFFVDNTFNFPPSYAEQLCQLMIDQGLDIAWRCILYPWRVSESLVKTMARAGCAEVSLGFESGSERILRNMNKRFQPDDVREISGILKDHGIRPSGFLLLGGPGENRESAETSFAFADSLQLAMMKITVGIRIYPGTRLAQQAIAEGFIEEKDSLLFPQFYLARELEDWLPETARQWICERPAWSM